MSNSKISQAAARITSLLDDNSFVEIGGLVSSRNTDFNLSDKDTPADGVITGYGTIDDRLVYVYSQDSSVLGGSVGEMHARKIAAIYDLAIKMGAPVIGLIDSVGLRLEEAGDALDAFGKIYAKQVEASGLIPQITAVFGNCGGGLAVASALSDFTFMEGKNAKLFVNSPNTLAGNKTDDTASAAFQSESSGLVDFMGSESEIFTQIRELISILPSNFEDNNSVDPADDLNRASAIDAGLADPAYVFAELGDGRIFTEVKKDFAKDMVTGFIRLGGTTVGVFGNRTAYTDDKGETVEIDSVLTTQGMYKAADFVKFCDSFNIPVLSYTNTKGFEATKASERTIARAAAKLTSALASSDVPKVNLIAGDAYGSAYVVMNSKAIGADMTFALPDSKLGMMDARLAAEIIYADEPDKIDEGAAKYEQLQTSITSAGARGLIDNVVEPANARKYLISAFEMLYSKRTVSSGRKHTAI